MTNYAYRLIYSLDAVAEFSKCLAVQEIDSKVCHVNRETWKADDGYDLIAYAASKSGNDVLVDVKKSDLYQFNSVEDMVRLCGQDPIACQPSSYERGTAEKYVFFNKWLTGYISIDARTKDRWYQRELHNRLEERNRDYWMAPAELWTYYDNQWMQALKEADPQEYSWLDRVAFLDVLEDQDAKRKEARRGRDDRPI